MPEPSDRPIRRRGRRAARPGSRARGSAASAVAAVLLVGLLLGGCGSSARAAHSTRVLAVSTGDTQGIAAITPGVAEAPCGAAAATAARTVALAAEAIYRLELNSIEVRADRREVEGYRPLLSALAAGDRAGIAKAVKQLVYSHTHIVRLRITRADGAVLDDLGGAYSIAPVSGQLRLDGSVLGDYVLSVQDDVGYVKLEKRYIGEPLLLRSGSAAVPVEGVLRSGSAALPDEGPVTYRGARDQAVSFDAENVPASRLTVTLLVPAPPAGLGCAAIRVFELGHVTQTMWRRFVEVSAPPSAFVKSAASLTGALVYVRAGARQLAGNTIPGPAHLPAAGTVSYRGVLYSVTSFGTHTAAGAVRVFALIRS